MAPASATHDDAPSDLPTELAFAFVVSRAATLIDHEHLPAIDALVLQGDDGTTSTFEERLDHAGDLLGLSIVERIVLAAVLLVDVAPEVGRAIALDDLSAGRRPSPRAIARLLADEGLSGTTILSVLDASGGLRRSGAVTLLDVPAGRSPLDRAVAAGDRLVALVLGVELQDPDAGGRLRRVDELGLPLGRPDAVDRIRTLLASPAVPSLYLDGPDAERLAAEATGGLVVVSAADLGDARLRATARLTSTLEGRAVAVDRLDELDEEARTRLPTHVAALGQAVWIGAGPHDVTAVEDLALIPVAIAPPTTAERRAAWRSVLGPEPDVDAVSVAYRLPIGRIADALFDVAADADGEPGSPSSDRLVAAARRASAARLGELAQAVPTDLGWDDLILPGRALSTLHTLAAFLRQRDRVLVDWGFQRRTGRAQGLVAMFTGESGTGKTLAARVLAADLGLELFRVDLSTLVSKWIGETERNLDRIFTAASGSNAVIFFDEADAIFGKRSQISDSRDRYANLETSYLLQRLEHHDGPVVLATNLRGNIDEAFLRRFDAVVEFPFPDPGDRRRLWDLLLPDAAPRADDVDLDFLAERIELSGGAIRNACLAAAVLAAEEGAAIGMPQLVRGVALEFAKLGRLTLAADFGEHFRHVREGR